jgi:thioredoxin-dependent peroxiredoxin
MAGVAMAPCAINKEPSMQSFKTSLAVAVVMTFAFSSLAAAQPAAAAAKGDAKELKVGDAAPDFALAASDGKTYKLSDFKGKQAVVVAWFPKAFTRGCTVECASLAANADKIRKYDVSFFMASVDPVEGEKGNKAFAESHKASFPVLGDPEKTTASAYGVLNARGMSNRWTFYIDKDGKVAAIDKAVKPETAAEDMIKKLEELKVPQK